MHDFPSFLHLLFVNIALGIVCIFASAFANHSYAQARPGTAAERLNGLQKGKLLEERSVLKDIRFRNIGPGIMSGRVVDVDVNPLDPTEFYVAYASGGLWHSKNNGQSLVPVFDKEDVITIGDIAVNWKTRTIWVVVEPETGTTPGEAEKRKEQKQGD